MLFKLVVLARQNRYLFEEAEQIDCVDGAEKWQHFYFYPVKHKVEVDEVGHKPVYLAAHLVRRQQHQNN
jgi:hypothetical protein